MKIVYIITRIDEIGGAQIHVKDVACRMSGSGHTVTVISGKKYDEHYLDELEKNNIVVHAEKRLVRNINLLDDFIALMGIIKILRKEKPDLISLHASKAGFLGRIAGFIIGTPTLFTAHGWSFSEGVPKKKAWFYAIAEKLASYLVKRIINVCYYDKNLAVKYKIASVHKLKVIRNGMPDIPAEMLAKTGGKQCRIVMTARFAPPKDHKLLLSRLKNIKNHPWHLDFIGTGPSEKNIKDLVQKLGLKDRITFHGQTHKVKQILSKAQFFILITNWEGLPRSIIEALRAGLPVVASNVGGIAELVEHCKNGYLIPRSDSARLDEYLRLLLTDSVLRESMGKESRRKYEKEFTFENMFKKTLAVYEELLYS